MYIGFHSPDELLAALKSSNIMQTNSRDLSKTVRAILQLYLEQVEGYKFPVFEPKKVGRPRKKPK